MHCHYFALSKYLRFFRKYTFLVFFRLIPMTMFFGYNIDCFCFSSLALDDWHFSDPLVFRLCTLQKTWTTATICLCGVTTNTIYKVLCRNGRFRGWFFAISMNYTLVCVLYCWAFCQIVTLSAENKVDLIAANMSSNQGSLPGNVYI